MSQKGGAKKRPPQRFAKTIDHPVPRLIDEVLAIFVVQYKRDPLAKAEEMSGEDVKELVIVNQDNISASSTAHYVHCVEPPGHWHPKLWRVPVPAKVLRVSGEECLH